MREQASGIGSCPSADVLEAIAAGRPVLREAMRHVESCLRCTKDVASFRENIAFLAELGPALKAGGRSHASTPTATSSLLSTGPDAGVPSGLLPGYTIIREIQRGAQGVIYLAVQDRTKRYAAVKVLLHGAFATERQQRRFELEMEVAARLRHPAIVTVYDSVAASGGRLAYAMEYVEDGVPLDEWAKRVDNGTTSPLESRLRLFVQVCHAVQHAHHRGVIHRDLKPANILVDAAGSPRVLDFGIAKTLDRPDRVVTNTGEIVGTPAYASPEQVGGNPDLIDTRSDVYSLGAVLYELITGTLPYDLGESIADVVRTIREAPPRSLTRTHAGVDRDLETIVLRALEKDPERRYQSVGALAADIEHWLADEPIEAKRDRVWYVLSRMMRKHRVIISAASMVLVALIAGGGATVVSMVRARDAAARESSAKERAAAERTRAASETARSEAISGVLNELIPPWGGEFASNAEYVPRKVIDRIRSRLDAGLHAARPDVEVASRLLLGDIYRDRGLSGAAEMQYATAFAIARKLLPPKHPDAAASAVRLAGVLAKRGENSHATRLMTDLIDAATPTDPGLPLVTVTLAQINFSARAFDEAERYARRTLVLAPEPTVQDAAIRAQAIDVLAQIAYEKGDNQTAWTTSKEAIATRFTSLGDGHPSLVPNLEFLAQLLTAMGEPAEDAVFYRNAKTGVTGTADMEDWRIGISCLDGVRSHVFQGDRSEVAQTRMMMAMIHIDQGNHRAAVKCFEEAAGFLMRENEVHQLTLAACLGSLASEYSEMGRLMATVGALDEQIRIYTKSLEHDGATLIMRAKVERASALARVGRFTSAADAYRDLLDDDSGALLPDDRTPALVRFASLLVVGGEIEKAAGVVKGVAEGSPPDAKAAWACEASLMAQAALVLDARYVGPAVRVPDEFERWRPLMSTWRNYRSVVEKMREVFEARRDTDAAGLMSSLLEERDRVDETRLRITVYGKMILEDRSASEP